MEAYGSSEKKKKKKKKKSNRSGENHKSSVTQTNQPDHLNPENEYGPRLTQSDVEREESLEDKSKVPKLPIFVSMHLSKRCPKIRRVHTKLKGLFVYNGWCCVYWPALEEIPTRYPDELKDVVRKRLDPNDEKGFQKIINDYEKYYPLWHIYGAFVMGAYDSQDLEEKFTERLHDIIMRKSVDHYFQGLGPGNATRWKRNLINDTKYSCTHGGQVSLKAAKLELKPFIEVETDLHKKKTFRKGRWEDDPESDIESRASPPRYRI